KLPGYALRNLALNLEDISDIAIVMLRPQVGIGARSNQLRADAKTVRHALDAAFEYISNAELAGYLGKFSRGIISILHHACSADHFNPGDFREVGQDFVLDSIREKRIRLVVAQVFEGQDGNALFRNVCRRLALRRQGVSIPLIT